MGLRRVSALAVVGACTLALGNAKVPLPPKDGPGSPVYPHGSVRVSSQPYGSDSVGTVYHLFEPAEPTPASAPVLLYLHGYTGQTHKESRYEPMLRHLARKGTLVIYVTYGAVEKPWTYEANAVKGFKAAIDALSQGGHVRPELDRFAIAGHSLGGALALRLASRWDQQGLPSPRAVVLHEAAVNNTPFQVWLGLNDLKRIPQDTVLVGLVAERSWSDSAYVFNVSVPATIRHVWSGTEQIPARRKNVLLVPSDKQGDESLESDHLGVFCTPEHGHPLDAVDWYGYWKPTEAALDFAFRGEHAAFVLDDTSEARAMGSWPDGTPVKAMLMASDLGL